MNSLFQVALYLPFLLQGLTHLTEKMKRSLHVLGFQEFSHQEFEGGSSLTVVTKVGGVSSNIAPFVPTKDSRKAEADPPGWKAEPEKFEKYRMVRKLG